MAKVVVIKFKRNCKPYYFSRGDLPLKRGQNVVVETARGLEYGRVVLAEKEVPDESVSQPLKPVIRIATPRDDEIYARNEARRDEALKLCKEKVAARGLPMKLIDCEFAFDGSKVTFTFTAENRVDFRELVRDLAAVFHMRIELRQVGSRDETRILGGIAPCGRVCCCAGAMPEFKKVSIKMAKNQNLSLNPGKISGLCGRLMCCLAYENDYYAGVCKKMPKMGSTVGTPEGNGSVIAMDMLKMTVKVKIEKEGDGGTLVYRDFPVDEIQFRRGEKDDEKDDDAEDVLPEEETAPSPEPKSDRHEKHKDRGKNRPEHKDAQGDGRPNGNNANNANNGNKNRHDKNRMPHKGERRDNRPAKRPEEKNPEE